jgi:outer membrane protein assembly factor BamA
VRLLALLVLSCGCVAHRTGDAVKSFKFEGNERKGYGGLLAPQTDRALKNAMNHEGPRWQSFIAPGLIEPTWLDRGLLDKDGRRIEVWYANHGFFDARFLGWSLTMPPPKEGKRLRAVKVVGYVDQGVPSRVTTIAMEGIDKLARPTRERLKGLVAVKSGDIFDRDRYRATISALENHLRANAFAYAKVEGEVTVRPDTHEVQVRLTVNPGPVCTFGAVDFTGKVENVDTKLLEPLVTIRPGKGYTTKELAKTRTNLYGLRVFSVVNVEPDLSDPSRTVIPIHIELRSTASRELRAGPEFQLEPGKQYLVGNVGYNSYNVAHRLYRSETELQAGVATLVSSVPELGQIDPKSDVAPIVSLDTKFTMPRLARHLTFTQEGIVELDAEPGYRLFSPSYKPSISWDGIPHFTPSLGYRIQYFDFFTSTFDTDISNVDVTCADTSIGDNTIDPGLLSVLEQGITWDSRNDPIEPHKGWYWTLAFAEAGLGGNYDFFRTTGDVRTFTTVFGRRIEDLVVGARLGAGFIQPYGGDTSAAVPHPERLFLGGANSVRGWAADSLGPIGALDCDGNVTPEGGNVSLYGNLEGRVKTVSSLYWALFVDAGRVWANLSDIPSEPIQVSVGTGLRYLTPIGPIRIDFGYVLNQDAEFARTRQDTNGNGYLDVEDGYGGFRPWAVHFGLSEAF